MGQYMNSMRYKSEVIPGFDDVDTESDVLELLKMIKKVYFNMESHMYLFHASHA